MRGDVANRRDRTLRIATVDVAYGRIPLKRRVWRGFGWATVPEVGDAFVLLAACGGRGGVYAGIISGNSSVSLKRARRLRF
jgi:hypothetical protein